MPLDYIANILALPEVYQPEKCLVKNTLAYFSGAQTTKKKVYEADTW
jgi:hypothetical protein